MKAPVVLEHVKPVHITASNDNIAEIVIMPGDPLRAKYIAENFLTEATLVNPTRNMFAYTGYYKNKRITVMGSGMGMPSMSIYAFELYYFFDVKRIVRIGSCGALDSNIKIGDIILSDEAYNEGTFAYSYNGDPTHYAYPTKSLTDDILKLAKSNDLRIHVGSTITVEQFSFYSDEDHVLSRVPKHTNLIGSEMEAFALFHIATSLNREAACLLTVSDNKYTTDFMSSEERTKSLNDMIVLALDACL